MLERKEAEEQKIRSLAGHLIKEKPMCPTKIRELAEAARSLEMLNFGIEHFTRVEGVTVDESGDPIGQGEGYFPKYAYTCDQWSPETGECKCYQARPWTCESFICGAATEARVPTHKDFGYSAQISDEEAAEILERRTGPGALIEEVVEKEVVLELEDVGEGL